MAGVKVVQACMTKIVDFPMVSVDMKFLDFVSFPLSQLLYYTSVPIESPDTRRLEEVCCSLCIRCNIFWQLFRQFHFVQISLKQLGATSFERNRFLLFGKKGLQVLLFIKMAFLFYRRLLSFLFTFALFFVCLFTDYNSLAIFPFLDHFVT